MNHSHWSVNCSSFSLSDKSLFSTLCVKVLSKLEKWHLISKWGKYTNKTLFLSSRIRGKGEGKSTSLSTGLLFCCVFKNSHLDTNLYQFWRMLCWMEDKKTYFTNVCESFSISVEELSAMRCTLLGNPGRQPKRTEWSSKINNNNGCYLLLGNLSLWRSCLRAW